MRISKVQDWDLAKVDCGIQEWVFGEVPEPRAALGDGHHGGDVQEGKDGEEDFPGKDWILVETTKESN